jgi:hypothetical protein
MEDVVRAPGASSYHQAVERTFPDIPYFELERVRTALVTVLFLFSVLNPDVGYRQVSQNQWVNAD